MRYRKLNKRLTAIAQLVRNGAVIYDVGTDHAYLPCYLARTGEFPRIYACDLNPKPLEFARTHIEKQGADIVLVQSNGLADVPLPENGAMCDVVIAGMGGELIAEIVSKMPKQFKNVNNCDLRLILQPMSRAEHLRRGLHECGCEIILEKTVFENDRNFIIIYAKLI
jgi:tRNA (adenine22-N1)-methyltransferase